ncbi:MAG: TonB family protein [Burkholderiales bacterium]|nr:TonB family protein [Burkholderiales bacterium]
MSTATTPLMAIYRGRDWFATLPTVLVLLALVGMGYDRVRVIHYKDEQKPVEVKLIENMPPEPTPEQPTPPTPTPQEPSPQKVTPQPVQQQAAPTPTTTPVATTSAPTAETVPAPAAPAAEPVKAVEAQPPVKPVSANLEGDYIAKIRGHLNAIKRYPRGRDVDLQHPQGKVRVAFTLNRDGSVSGDVEVTDSSNSQALDNEAKKTVYRGQFPPFPQTSWPGEASHRFTAELEFVSPS